MKKSITHKITPKTNRLTIVIQTIRGSRGGEVFQVLEKGVLQVGVSKY